jgi:hypothetical protein
MDKNHNFQYTFPLPTVHVLIVKSLKMSVFVANPQTVLKRPLYFLFAP